jgi:hypothetical protein
MIHAYLLLTLPILTVFPPGSMDGLPVDQRPAPEMVPVNLRIERPVVDLIAVGSVKPGAEQTFVIVHGMGGTVAGDRFHGLAGAIKKRLPAANVYRLDWSVGASRKLRYGLPDPWAAARSINRAGDAASERLSQQHVAPSSVTLIGESFGVYVNHRIVKQFGKVRRVLAFNPASEMGGYFPPSLQQDAERVCVFTTLSGFDTWRYLADSAVRLMTGPQVDVFAQHRYGIQWLHRLLDAGNLSWLELAHTLNLANHEHLSGSVGANGEIDQAPVARWLRGSSPAALVSPS